MSYKKPTLDEVYLVVLFTEGTLPGAKHFDVVPLLKKVGLTDIEMGQVVRTPPEVEAPTVVPRVRCWDKERLRLVQLSQDVLIINQTKEYLGWTAFLQLVLKTLELLQNAGVEPNYSSVELHTLDRFSVPREDFRLGEWLNCGGRLIPEFYKDSSEASDINLGLGLLNVDRRNRQLDLDVRPRDDNVEIRFNSTFHDMLARPGDIESTLAKLHDESNSWFESIITDRVRQEIMQGMV